RVTVRATSLPVIGAIAAGGAGAETFALGGSVTLNTIANDVSASVNDAAAVAAAGRVTVSAEDNASIRSLAGGGAGAGTVASGPPLPPTPLSGTPAAASIHLPPATPANAPVQVPAAFSGEIGPLPAGGAGAEAFALGGAV